MISDLLRRVLHGLAACMSAIWATQAVGAIAGVLPPPDIPLGILALIMIGFSLRSIYIVIFGEEP